LIIGCTPGLAIDRGANGAEEGVEEDVVRVAAGLPHSKPGEARVVDVITFGGNPKRRRFNNYPPDRKIYGVPKEAASLQDTITCDVALYTKGQNHLLFSQ